MTNLLNRNVFQKLLRLTNYALFIGENLVLKILKKAMLVDTCPQECVSKLSRNSRWPATENSQ